jgi:hypothetical protein
MDKALAFGAIVTLLAFWMIYREWRSSREPLPPPLPDERDKLTEWWRFWEQARRG